MVNVIDMQDLRHLNLFGKITHVRTRFCIRYNDGVIFCVPKGLVSKSIGEGGKNIRQINKIIGKKVKVVQSPVGISDAKKFIESIVSPVKFKDLEVKDNEIVLTAGSMNKAALLGRNKRRLLEMQKIVKGFFGKEFRII